MNLAKRVLRWICLRNESERMEYRKDISRLRAHTEDLSRTVILSQAKAKELYRRAAP
jgi:hypothetical protein